MRSAEEFDEILDRVAGIGVGDGGIGLPLSTPVPIPGGARNASRNSTVMGKSRGKVGHPGMADNTGMSVNPGVAGKPGVAGNFNMVSFGGIGGLDCRVLGAELTAGGPKNRTAHEFFEEDEAAAPLSALASDNSTGLVPSFMMFASITGCGTVTDGCGRGKMQSPASAPPAGSRQLAALGYPHMGSGPVRSGSGGVPTVSTPPGFRHGSRMQTAERGWPVTSPGSHGSQQQQQQQFPCDSNRRQGSLPLGSSQGHPQNKGHPQQSSVDTRGWTMLGTHSGSSVGQLQRAYHAAGKQSELVYPPGSSAEATFANHQPMPDGNCQSASATPPGLQRGHQLPFDATPTPTFEFLCSVEGASALGSNVPGGPLNDVAVKYDPPALPQVMPSFASLPPSGTTAPGLAADESPKPYHDTSVQPLAAGGGTAALGRVCSQQPPSPALPSTYRSASSLSMSLPAASTSTASQPARFEAADTGILEMTVQNAHVDVLQKFLTKFGA